jgi:hypothetical protein
MLALVNFAATLIMVGVIWVMQFVHYPLFSMVGRAEFPAYEIAHMGRITLVVLPFMFTEAITALMLALNPPAEVNRLWLWLGLGLVALIWLITFFYLDSQHGALSAGFDANVLQSLLDSNWIRTIAWSSRAILMFFVVWRLLKV